MRSVPKERNAKERERWHPYSLQLSHLHFCYCTQTLTTLDLESNEIGAEGAQHLSDALKHNTVREILSSTVSSSFLLLHTDTHDTRPRMEWNQRWRCSTSEWCIEPQHSKRNTLFNCLIFIFVIVTRHSRHSTSKWTGSEMKVLHISVMHWTTTQ